MNNSNHKITRRRVKKNIDSSSRIHVLIWTMSHLVVLIHCQHNISDAIISMATFSGGVFSFHLMSITGELRRKRAIKTKYYAITLTQYYAST
jgi:hypothetical protein